MIMQKGIFYLTFALAFLVGGAVFLMGIPFRLFYLAPLVIFLLPVCGVRIGNVEKIFFFFLLEIVLSAIINHVSISQFLSFLRFIGIPYSMYYLCKNYITQKNVKKIIRLCIIVACLQPPLILIQQLFFQPINSILPPQVRYLPEQKIDFSFGSFYVSDDPAMSFFLMGLIIFLLFDTKNNRFIRNRITLAAYFTLGVLLSNSQLSNVLVILIWMFLLLGRLKLKHLVRSLFVVCVSALLISSLGFFPFLKWKISNAIEQASIESIQSASGDGFEQGSFERTAAIYFYVTQPLKIWGDGPSVYFDALNREFTIGNTGQIFTLYAEVGIVGLLFGYWIFFAMSQRSSASKKMAWGCFLLMSALTITSFVLSDASLMLAFNIFLKTNLVSRSDPEQVISIDTA